MAYTSITKKLQEVIDGLTPELPQQYNYYIGVPFWFNEKNVNDINYFPNIIFINTSYIDNNFLGTYSGKITTSMLINEHSEEDSQFIYMEETILSKVLEELNDTFDEVNVLAITFDDTDQGTYTIAVDLEILFEYKQI